MSPDKPANTGPPPIDDAAFRDLLAKPSVAREMLLPFGRARWDGNQYTLGRGERTNIIPTISGVRVQEPDANNVEMYREKGCQRDLVSVIRSVMELRRCPQLSGMVLGDARDVLVGPQAGEPRCKRVLFGLHCPADGRFRAENEAAAECHRQIVAAGRKAEHLLREEVPAYDPHTGFTGLLAWADRVRWRRRRTISPWWLLLLLLPLLFLPCLCLQGPEKIRFFDTEIETDSLIILMDKSKSMEPYFPAIQKETRRFLAEFKRRKRDPHADIIFYDKDPKSVLEAIEKLDDVTFDTLTSEVDKVKASGGTNLKSALKQAGKEIGVHRKPTTILVLTDGKQTKFLLSDLRDEIARNQSDSEVIKPLKGTPTVLKWIPAHSMTGPPPRPPDADEKKWDATMDGLKGAFNSAAPPGAGGSGPGKDGGATAPGKGASGPDKGGASGPDKGGATGPDKGGATGPNKGGATGPNKGGGTPSTKKDDDD